MTTRYLSLLASTGITLHDGDSASIIPCQLPLEDRRRLLAKASRLDKPGASKSEAPLREVIRASRAKNSTWFLEAPVCRRQAGVDFGTLCERDDRWRASSASDWTKIALELRKLGYSFQERPRREENRLLNTNELLPVGEVISSDGTVIGGGKGTNADAVIRTALGEAAERIVAQEPLERTVFVASARDLRRANFGIPSFTVGTRDAYCEDTALEWVAAFDLAGNPAALPAMRSYYNYIPRAGILPFALDHSAGLGAGATIEEAIWAGFTECLERDAYWIVMRCRLACPNVDESCINPDMLHAIKSAGLRLVLKDISLDWPLKIIHALLMDDTDRLPAFAHGIGSHTSVNVAAIKAVCEASQNRSDLLKVCEIATSEVVFASAAGKAPQLAWSDPASATLLSHLWERPSRQPEWQPSEPGKGDPQRIIEKVDRTAGPIFWAPLGMLADLLVVRVFIHACVPPDHSADLIYPRLQRWLERTGIRYPHLLPILT